MTRLRTVFFGSPELAVPTLAAVAAAEEVVAVVTQPDKPAGRGRKLAPPAVKEAAQQLGLPVLQPTKIRTEEFRREIEALRPDVAVVVAYGRILPQALLDVPPHGFLNVHASLLPRYRGAAPIQWAIIRGEATTGVTIMKLDAGMDTGPMLLSRAIAIRPEDTAGSIAARLGPIGADLMVTALGRLKAGALVETPQDDAQATLAPMLKKEDGRVPWARPAADVASLIRGVDPWPGAWAQLEGEVLKLWGARVVEGRGGVGQVLDVDRDGLIVACGEGAVAIAEAQLPGRRRMPVAALVAGRAIPPGTVLG